VDHGPLDALLALFGSFLALQMCAATLLGALGPRRNSVQPDNFEGIFDGVRVRYQAMGPGRHRWAVSVRTGSLSLRIEPQHFELGGDTLDRSWLTAPVRAALLELLPCSVTLQSGVLCAEDITFEPRVGTRLAKVARLLVQVPAEPRERLRQWMGSVQEQRGEAFLALAEQDPALALELAPTLIGDRHPLVRERAAQLLLGLEGRLPPAEGPEIRLWVARTFGRFGRPGAERLMPATP
jgi:hypothetical protein